MLLYTAYRVEFGSLIIFCAPSTFPTWMKLIVISILKVCVFNSFFTYLQVKLKTWFCIGCYLSFKSAKLLSFLRNSSVSEKILFLGKNETGTNMSFSFKLKRVYKTVYIYIFVVSLLIINCTTNSCKAKIACHAKELP